MTSLAMVNRKATPRREAEHQNRLKGPHGEVPDAGSRLLGLPEVGHVIRPAVGGEETDAGAEDGTELSDDQLHRVGEVVLEEFDGDAAPVHLYVEDGQKHQDHVEVRHQLELTGHDYPKNFDPITSTKQTTVTTPRATAAR